MRRSPPVIGYRRGLRQRWPIYASPPYDPSLYGLAVGGTCPPYAPLMRLPRGGWACVEREHSARDRSIAALGQEGSAADHAILLAQSGITPIMAGFQGGNLSQKLASGYAAARARLLKYTSTLSFNKGAAEELVHEIRSWQERNRALIDEYMKHPGTDTLPEQIALKLGPEKAQQLVVAGFSEAARGLGPWLGGDIIANYKTDPQIPEKWVVADAEKRLAIFASIVKMDDDGDLFKIFKPEEYRKLHPAVQGFGGFPAIPVGVLIVLALVVVTTVALVFVYLGSMEELRLNNKIMEDRCRRAEERGDTELVKLCIEAAQSATEKDSGLEGLFRSLFRYALIGGVIYTAAFIALPMVTEKVLKQKAPAT